MEEGRWPIRSSRKGRAKQEKGSYTVTPLMIISYFDMNEAPG